MLARARQRLTAAALDADLIQAPMQDFSVPRRARLAIIPLDTFGHLLAQDDQLQCLAAVRRALMDDGLLVVDVSNGNNRAEPRDEVLHQLTAESPDGHSAITKWVSRSPDTAEQIDDLSYWYDITGSDGVLRRTTVEFQLRYFTRFELTLLLERAGFAFEVIYGSYELDELQSGSDRLIVVGRK
jgi:hypothetical protein